jgi:uncharacterized membrane protein
VEGGAGLRDDELKIVALALIGLTAAVAIYPILAEYRGVVEPFSELGILGPNMKLGDYPRELAVGQSFSLYLYVGNHEGGVEYFRVLAKLGDVNSNVSDTTPLDAPVLASWDFVLPNESNSTLPITLSLDRAGLNQRVVFELDMYDSGVNDFVYHQRWTQLWMNVTSPGLG